LSTSIPGIKVSVRKVIHRVIRINEEGLQVAADLHAVIAVNVDSSANSSRTEAHSRTTVVQDGAGRRDQPDVSSEEQPPGPPTKEKP